MKYSDEAGFLLERINAIDAADINPAELLGVQKSLAEIVCRLAKEFDKLSNRVDEFETTADTLSEDVFALQTKIGKEKIDKIQNLNNADIASMFTADDEDGEFDDYIHCPHCNTLIFVADPDQEDIKCPFCGETFKKEDASL